MNGWMDAVPKNGNEVRESAILLGKSLHGIKQQHLTIYDLEMPVTTLLNSKH